MQRNRVACGGQEAVNRQARQSVDEKDGARLLALRSLQMTKEELESKAGRMKAELDELRPEIKSLQNQLGDAERGRKVRARVHLCARA